LKNFLTILTILVEGKNRARKYLTENITFCIKRNYDGRIETVKKRSNVSRTRFLDAFRSNQSRKCGGGKRKEEFARFRGVDGVIRNSCPLSMGGLESNHSLRNAFFSQRHVKDQSNKIELWGCESVWEQVSSMTTHTRLCACQRVAKSEAPPLLLGT